MGSSYQQEPSTSGKPAPWWFDKKDPHHNANAAIDILQNRDSMREEAYLKFNKRYTQRDPSSLCSFEVGHSFCFDSAVRINITRSIIDNLLAQHTTNSPRVQFVTKGGDWSARRRAEGLTKFVDGLFYSTNLYRKFAEEVAVCCYTYGSGLVYPEYKDGKMCVTPVHPGDVYVSEAETDGMYGNTQFYWLRHCDRDVLAEMYPKHRASIMRAGLMVPHKRARNPNDEVVDEVSVLYCWRVGPDKKNNKFCICTTDCTLEYKDWGDREPFVKLDLFPNPKSYFGIGVAEYAGPEQAEITYLAQKIQGNMQAASGRVWLDKSMSETKITNKPGAIIYYSGKPPVFEQHSTLSGDIFGHLQWLIAQMYSNFGLSPLTSQGEVPTGIESGTALRALNQIASKRHQHIQQAHEQFFVDIAEAFISIADEIGTDLSVVCPDAKYAKEIKFKDVRLDRKEYVMRPWPANLLSETPAGKIEDMMRLTQMAPQMQPHVFRLMSDIPDMEKFADRMNAPQNIAEKMIDAIIQEGVVEPPFPEMDIVYAKQMGREALLDAILMDVPPDRVAKLRAWNKQLDAMQEQAEQQMMMKQLQLQNEQMMMQQSMAPGPTPATPMEQPMPTMGQEPGEF